MSKPLKFINGETFNFCPPQIVSHLQMDAGCSMHEARGSEAHTNHVSLSGHGSRVARSHSLLCTVALVYKSLKTLTRSSTTKYKRCSDPHPEGYRRYKVFHNKIQVDKRHDTCNLRPLTSDFAVSLPVPATPLCISSHTSMTHA